jgi:hypothetical protein
VTDELLKGLAHQGANMAKTDLRYRHQINGVIAFYCEGAGLHRMRKVELEIEAKFGRDWLNSGQAKDTAYGVLRLAVKAQPPDAIVIVNAADKFETTTVFDALSNGEKERVFRSQHPRDLPQYFQPHDALVSVAQSPERVCVFSQRLRGDLLIGEPEVRFFPQSAFDGRLKIYGVDPPAEMLEAFARVNARSFSGNPEDPQDKEPLWKRPASKPN